MWHYVSSLYGKQIKFLVFKKTKKKTAFGKPFFSIMVFLELRLNILLVRMRFVSKLLEANSIVSKGLVHVNGFLKKKSYLVRLNDIIRKQVVVNRSIEQNKKIRFFYKKWQKFTWRKWRKQTRVNKLGEKRLSIFRFSKKIVLSLNYLEINYKILSGIVLKRPALGEILLNSSKKILSSTMLKKIYFLY